jgi:PIN domain nuclease of toxin-antitoxin system
MIVLDTHVFVWLALQSVKLSTDARAAIERASGLSIAAISLCEAAWLMARGGLRQPGAIAQALDRLVMRTGVVVHPLTPSVAGLAATLAPPFPPDSAERLIAATALVHALPLVTRTRRFAAAAR